MKKTIPAISVIIPMYNAEKYIGECLDSILTQTFQDFEVIVVDDCSTDKSFEIVKSYLPKFNNQSSNKLQLLQTEKNSGAAGVPNNTGLARARGEYISFLEADDAITTTAFEELYPLAKEFDADVIHCEKYYMFEDDKNKATLRGYHTGNLVDAPKLITADMVERIEELRKGTFLLNLWTKLIRHDYIKKNNLKMINAATHDAIYTMCLVCSAERYVRVPNAVNYYRFLENSLSHKKNTVSKNMEKWIKNLTRGFEYFDAFLSTQDFFKKNPDMKIFALEIWVNECCKWLLNCYNQNSFGDLDLVIRKEFEKVENKNSLVALISFLFSRMNIFNLNLIMQNQTIQQLQERIAQLQR